VDRQVIKGKEKKHKGRNAKSCALGSVGEGMCCERDQTGARKKENLRDAEDLLVNGGLTNNTANCPKRKNQAFEGGKEAGLQKPSCAGKSGLAKRNTKTGAFRTKPIPLSWGSKKTVERHNNQKRGGGMFGRE